MSKVILIGGGSASGKTYVLRKVLEKIPSDKVAHISIDDYYKDFRELPFEERAKINFDHPKAFDWKLMNAQLKALKNGETIEKPIYDFTIHGRSDKTEIVESKPLIIIEGIMALVNKELRSLGDLTVFINASRERRLVRRIDRDISQSLRCPSALPDRRQLWRCGWCLRNADAESVANSQRPKANSHHRAITCLSQGMG